MVNEGEMTLDQFLHTTPKLKEKTLDDTVEERLIFLKDVFNYRGVSLHETYKALWKIVHEYKLRNVYDDTATQHYYQLLSTFPFGNVVETLEETVRSYLQFAMGNPYKPYTAKQWEAIQRVKTRYPYEARYKDLVNNVIKEFDAISTFLEEALRNRSYIIENEVIKRIEAILEVFYTIPDNYLWIVSTSFTRLLNASKQGLSKYLGFDAVSNYMTLKLKDDSLAQKGFSTQFVEDVTTLLIYQDMHPQMYLALLRVQQVKDLYYNPVDAAKLFITDVEKKINRYIEQAKSNIDPELIQYFIDFESGKLNQVTENTELTIDEIYTYFVNALDHYLSTRTGLKDVIEYATVLKSKSYQEVIHLPGFNERMKIVDELHQRKEDVDIVYY